MITSCYLSIARNLVPIMYHPFQNAKVSRSAVDNIRAQRMASPITAGSTDALHELVSPHASRLRSNAVVAGVRSNSLRVAALVGDDE